MLRGLFVASASAAVLLAAGPLAKAESVTIGQATAPTSIDPHFHNHGQNNANAAHVFSALSLKDERQRLTPGLALSWKPIDETTWEYKLRPGVKFHDGSPFTAEDVAASFKRAPAVPNSPGSFSTFLKDVAAVEIVDPLTVRVKTKEPAPLLPVDLSNVVIISQKHAAATTEDYTLGKAMVGTGPYKFVEWVPGDRIVYERNPDYWGEKEPWDRVNFKIIPSGPARVAALIAGDVHLIADIPTTDVERLKKEPNVAVWDGPSNRLVFIAFDPSADALKNGTITDKAGKPLDRNPLSDVRVREALARAINNDVIVQRVNQGEAIPTGQLVPEGFIGYMPEVRPLPFEPEKAKKLLADAGWGNGFRVTLVTSNDRIINSVKMVQAIAQMWARVGVETGVDTMPHTVFSERRNKLEFPVFLSSWGNSVGEASYVLNPLLHTRQPKEGYGASNRSRYSNPELDRMIKVAMAEMDEEKRDKLLQEASKVALADYGLVPILFQVNNWGTRKGYRYAPRIDQHTLAMGLRKAGS